MTEHTSLITIRYDLHEGDITKYAIVPTPHVGIYEVLQCRLIMGAWEVTSTEHGAIGHGGYKQEAILDYLKARLGIIEEQQKVSEYIKKKRPSIIFNAAIIAASLTGSIQGFALNRLPETIVNVLIFFLSSLALIQGMREGMRDDKEALRKELETAQIIAKTGPAEGWTRGEAQAFTEKIMKQASDASYYSTQELENGGR